MMRPCKLPFVFLVLFCFEVSSQERILEYKDKGEYLISLKSAFHRQKFSYGELGMYFALASRPNVGGSGFVYGPSISAEFLLKDRSDNRFSIVAPKIGFECYNRNLGGGPWGGRITLQYYTNGSEGSLKLGPELGLSLWHFLNLFYGYNIPLNNKDFIGNNGHKLTVMMNYPLVLKDYDKKPKIKE